MEDKLEILFTLVMLQKYLKNLHFQIEKNEIFNVGTGKPQTILYLTKLLKGKKIHISKRPGEPDFIKADISKIKRQLKWKPKISFEKGVSQLILII